MFTVIRVSSDYETVVVQSLDGKFYLYKWTFAKPGSFEEISEKVADGYGFAFTDGLGFGIIPEKPFVSLDEIIVWAGEGQKRVYEELAKILPPADEAERIKTLAGICLSVPVELQAKFEAKHPWFMDKLRKLAGGTIFH